MAGLKWSIYKVLITKTQEVTYIVNVLYTKIQFNDKTFIMTILMEQNQDEVSN